MNRHLIAWGICTETSLINQAPSICKHVCLSCSFQGTTTQTDNISKSKERWNIPTQILLQKPAIEKLLFLWTFLICLMRCLLSRCKTAMFSTRENHFFFQFLLNEKITKVRKPRKNNTNVLLLLNSKNSSVYFVNESSLPNIINNSIWLSWHTQEGRLLLLKINIEASAQLLWPEMELRVQVEYGFSILS